MNKLNLKIAWFHSHFLNWMGGHKYVFEVVKRLSQNYSVRVYASTASGFAIKQFKSINVSLSTINSVSTYSLRYWLLFPFMIRKEVNTLKKIIKDTDVVIASFFPAHIWAQELNIPYVQICYEPLAFFYDKDFLRSYSLPICVFFQMMKRLYAHVDKEALLRAEKVLTLSKHNASWISDLYGRRDIKVIYEGVDTDLYRPTDFSVLENQYKNKPIIFHSTDFTKTKGTDILLRAIPQVKKMFPDVQILITHTLKNPYEKEKLMMLSINLGIEDNLEFLGFIDQELLPAYYSLADVVVQPSRNQSMSLTVKEAMACGTPIITGTEGKEQTKDGEAGFLVDVDHVEELTRRIIVLLADKKLQKRMGTRGRKIILDKFSWNFVAASVEKTLAQIIKRHRETSNL